MHTLAGDEFLRAQLVGAAVVVLDLDAVAMRVHRSGGSRLASLDTNHGIAQQEGGTAHGLAGHDRLTRARRGAGVGAFSVEHSPLAMQRSGRPHASATSCKKTVLQPWPMSDVAA